jgi:hypothetical protein
MFGTTTLKYLVLFALLLGVLNLTSSSLFSNKKSMDVEKFEEEKNSLNNSVMKLEKIASDLKTVVDDMNLHLASKVMDDEHDHTTDHEGADDVYDTDDDETKPVPKVKIPVKVKKPVKLTSTKKEGYKTRKSRKMKDDVEEGFVNGMPTAFGGDYLLL